RLNSGLGFVPEDRSTDGVIAGFSITANFVLDMYDQPPYAGGIAMTPSVMRAAAVVQTDHLDVRLGTVEAPVSTLSAGTLPRKGRRTASTCAWGPWMTRSPPSPAATSRRWSWPGR